MPTLLEAFAASTISHRLRAGITPEILAAKAGVSATTIYSLEKAQANPTLSTMEAVAGALGISLPDMLLPKQPTEPASEPKLSFLEWLRKLFF